MNRYAMYVSLCTTLAVLLLSGCLSAQRKSYKITMTGRQSGTCTLTLHNIVSTKDDGRDVSLKDFAELVTDYVEGDKIEADLIGCRNIMPVAFWPTSSKLMTLVTKISDVAEDAINLVGQHRKWKK